MPRSALAFVVALSLIGPAFAHEGHVHEHDDANNAPKFPRGIILPAVEGPKPWSDKPTLDDPDRFQIAIMTDNTGGHRPGIWMKAVERLNLLRPTFVMSVGDLIEGYSEDPAEIEAEWKEFLGFIDAMQMKFFFVAGNHDVSNPKMHEMWRKHFGREWYSFDYRGVHFVALSSEDTHDQIGPEQLAWLKDDLAKRTDARWTLLFFHKPLWVISERAKAAGNEDKTNWPAVEKLLGDRPHSVFAGHVHHYVQYDRRGMKYYHLATTGGGSQLRGVPYGEFDHVAWLTMEPEGPTVVNLLLDGIVPPDAVTEKGIERFREFLAKTRLEAAPILVDADEGISSGRIDLRLKNTFDEPVEITAEIEGLPLRGLTVEPSAKLVIKAAAGETAELAVNVQFSETIAFEKLTETLLTAKIRTVGGDRPLTAERTFPVVIDRKYPCPSLEAKPTLDGLVGDWNELKLSTGEKPLVVGAAEQWQGPADSGIAFTTGYDDRFLYFAGHVTDDQMTTGDELQIALDARWIGTRRSDGNKLKTGVYRLAVPAPTGASGPSAVQKVPLKGSPKVTEASVATAAAKDGWTFEVAVPIGTVERNQSDKWHSFQATPIVVDFDETDQKPAKAVWRGTADYETQNTNWGQFVRGE